MKRYTYWLTGIVGLALIVAPFVLQFNTDTNALWSCIVLGVIVLVISAYEGLANDLSNWEYWLVGLAGALAIIAPFVMQYNGTDQNTQMWTSIILGGVTVILALYALLPGEGQQLQ